MNLLPVAERELRLLSRQPRTYRTRVLAASTVILVSLGMLYAGFGHVLSAASAGKDLFLLLALVGGAYVLLEGAILTGDCLSQEIREGTMGLLFLTGLRGYEILVGKLVPRLATSAFSLVAALPALAIALFLGGVTGSDFVCITLALLNALFFSACLGLLVSALCRRTRRALNAAVGAVVVLAGLIPAAGWAWSIYRQDLTIHPAFLLASPAGAFLDALGTGVVATQENFFVQSLACTHALSWAFLIAAGLILPRRWPESGRSDAPRPPGSARTSRTIVATAAIDPRGRWSENDFIWSGDRPSERGLGLWPALGIFAIAWGIGWACLHRQMLSLPIYAITVVVLNSALMWFVLLNACRGPAEDQRSGVLEILLTTPRGDEVYVRGRMLSLKRRCLWPVTVVLALQLGMMVAGCWESGTINWEWFAWIGLFTVLSFKLIADLYVLSWVGFWQGLKTGNVARAVRTTVFYVLLLRWIVLLGMLALLGLLTRGAIFQSVTSGVIAAVGYVVLLGMTLLHFCAAAVSELTDRLRLLALGASAEVGARSDGGWLLRKRREPVWRNRSARR